MSYSENTSVVSVQESPILEVRQSTELIAALTRVYKEGMPGFVIRAAGFVDTGVDADFDIRRAIVKTLQSNPELTGKPSGKTHTFYLGRPDMLLQKGKGDMHHDMGEGEVPPLQVHATTLGSGKVTLANAGTLGIEAYNSDLLEFVDELPSNTYDKAGPIFRAFDTSSLLRTAEVFAIYLQ